MPCSAAQEASSNGVRFWHQGEACVDPLAPARAAVACIQQRFAEAVGTVQCERLNQKGRLCPILAGLGVIQPAFASIRNDQLVDGVAFRSWILNQNTRAINR